jgi:hypothetical protein
MSDPSILHLTLKRRWFEMIASGIKREEYRELKQYWDKRLRGRSFMEVHFRNGYGANAPKMIVQVCGLYMGFGRVEWGAPESGPVYVLRLGEIIQGPNKGT